MNLESYIRSVPDFPEPGIVFRDLTPLLNYAPAFQEAIRALIQNVRTLSVQKVVGIESRGFIFGAAIADHLQAGFVPVRKSGKLPAGTVQQAYSLEYGTGLLEMHEDAIQAGDKVLVHDDLLATGGTALAACKLVEQLDGEVVHASFLMELSFLQGREQLKDYSVSSVIKY